MRFIDCIKADFYKSIKLKPLMLLHLIAPLSGVIFFNLYYLNFSWSEYLKVTGYIKCAAMMFPILSAISVSMVYQSELDCGKFQGIMSVPCGRIGIHLSKFLIIVFFGIISSLIAIAGFGTVFNALGHDKFSILFYINISLILLLLNFPIYMIQYIISFSLGRGASLGIGIIGTILSGFMYTGLGDGIWSLIPYSYGIRIISYIMHNINDLEVYKVMDVASVSLVIVIVFILWSESWHGGKGKIA